MRTARAVRRALPLAVVAAALAVPAAAETLQEAWALAARGDHALAAAQARADSARASERAARAARLPTLAASATALHFAAAPELALAAGGMTLRSPLFSGRDFTMAGLQLQVPLYTGGRITSSIRSARESRLGALSMEDAEGASLRLAVATAYVDVLRAQRRLASARSSTDSLRAHAGDVATMVEREAVPRSDLLSARVALANAEQQLVRADNGVALAKASYNRQLGEALERPVELDDALAVDTSLDDQPVEDLARQALGQRHELAGLQAGAQALDLQARAESSAQLPQLTLTGSRSWIDNEILDRRDISYVGLGLTWRLFDGGGARQRSEGLRHEARAVRDQAEDLRSRIELQVRQAWLELREARARLAAAQATVAEAEENVRASRELYGAGLATNTQVLDAVALQVAATGNNDDAELDVGLASLRLAHAVGTL